MAEHCIHDVVNQIQSMGENSPIGVPGNTITSNTTGEEEEMLGNTIEDSEYTISIIHSSSENTIDSSLAPGTKNITSEDPDEPVVNGDHPSHSEHEGTSDQNASSLDNAAISDADISKAESMEQSKEGATRHERSNSVIKKATSYKPVSVTKNFLAKTGTGLVTNGKAVNDKGLPASQSASPAPAGARPRLVAKSARDARLASMGNGSGDSGGPDASKVWNRNKPVPPPPPKQFTDEELKQQYGIHLATRLQADEAGKESKWADIDDDEEDWAPETVEWMDGTKSSLLPSERQPIPPTGFRSLSDKKNGDDTNQVTISANQRPSSILGPGKTILKPGAARSVGTHLKPGLVLKNAPEKPVPQVVPITTSTSKSPWAQLPPVDKASPVSFNPPAPPPSQQISNMSRTESQGPDTPIVSSSPTQEIDANDFHRSWRENERGHRELFNAQSGRYEPAKNPRRSSMRQDPGFRLPAVLQRPSQHGHAEPSAAFQTSRGSTNQDERTWGRRRGSSAMDDRSGQVDRHMSIDQTNHASTAIEAELKADVAMQNSTVPENIASPTASQSDTPAQASSTEPQAYTAHVPGRIAQAVIGASELQVRPLQQKLMRERIELNRKRKQEEEIREEAERRERIRVKMEALGPATTASEEGTTTELTQAEDLTGPGFATTKSSSEPQKLDFSVEDQTRIPQHALKTHVVAASSASTWSPEEQELHDTSLAQPAPEPLTSSQPLLIATKSPLSERQQSPESFTGHNSLVNASHEVHRLVEARPHQPRERTPQSWHTVPSSVDPAASWASPSMAAHSTSIGNVWGPFTSDRTLGNGAFEGEFQRLPSIQLPPQHLSQRSSHSPGPIGPPSTSPRLPSDTSRMVATHSPNHDMSYHNNPAETLHRVAPTGPVIAPVTQQPISLHHEPFFRQHPPELHAAKRAWINLPAQLAQDQAEARVRGQREHAARLDEEIRTGVRKEYRPIYSETFRQTIPGDTLGHRQVISVSKTTHDHNAGFGTPSGHTSFSHQHIHPLGIQPLPLHSTVNSRASRFFGPGVDRGQMAPVSGAPDYCRASEPASPPPPDCSDHPAFDAVSRHPHVNLPPPIPRVSLPRVAVTTVPTQETVTMPVRPMPVRSGAQPIVSQTAWQDRINGLLRPKQQPSAPPLQDISPPVSKASLTTITPKPQPLAIDSSSKAPLDAFVAQEVVTVSVPQNSADVSPVDTVGALPDDLVQSKSPVEELMDEREFGSSPIVNLPKASYANMQILLNLPHQKWGSKYAQVEMSYRFSSSTSPLSFDLLDGEQKVEAGFRISIRVPGKSLITKILPRKAASHSHPHQFKAPRNNNSKKRMPSNKGVNNGASYPQQSQSGLETPPESRPIHDPSTKTSARPQDNRGNRVKASTTGPPKTQHRHFQQVDNLKSVSATMQVTSTAPPSSGNPSSTQTSFRPTTGAPQQASLPPPKSNVWAKPPRGRPSNLPSYNHI